MSQAITLARPYARAAFALARDEGDYPAWSQALALAAQVAADSRAAQVLANPALRCDDAVTLLGSDNASPQFARFLSLLFENRRLQLLPEIAGLFEQLRAEAEQIIKARVISAEQIGMVEFTRIKAALRNRFGREVEITTEIDPSLIGGAIIDTGDLVIDGSLKGKLARLSTSLAQ